MNNKIQLFVPFFRTEECLAEIRDCLNKGWTGLGYKTVILENEWKAYTGFKNAFFLNSATAGLDMAIKVLKMENSWNDDDEIISTPITFVSTNHAILYNKMKVVFADVDEFLCLDPGSVLEKITKKTKAVLFVGLGGNTGSLPEIEKICGDKGIKLILDAAHMSGTRLNGEIPGKNCDAVVYSFQAVKNMPTADSGMICFKESRFDDIVRKLAWLGINKDTFARAADEAYKWKYDVEYVGYKNHGNAIMAAMGLVSLKYLDKDNAYRRQIAKWYDNEFVNSEKIRTVPIAKGCESSRHLYQILVNNRDDLITYLNANGIYPGVHYIDNTEYNMYSYAKGTCPNATNVSEHILSLPIHMQLTKTDISYISNMVKEYA
jgi:dTDP-4-amino-4,6-dideoxygalactose transaminase